MITEIVLAALLTIQAQAPAGTSPNTVLPPQQPAVQQSAPAVTPLTTEQKAALEKIVAEFRKTETEYKEVRAVSQVLEERLQKLQAQFQKIEADAKLEHNCKDCRLNPETFVLEKPDTPKPDTPKPEPKKEKQ